MQYNYDKLNGKIREVFGTQDDFAKAINRSSTSINYKLNNKTKFTQDEISKSIEALHLLPEDIPLYFFNKKVENISTE